MLTIKNRLLLIGAVTMAAILVALVLFLSVQLHSYSKQQALNDHLRLSEKLVEVISSLQRERGETTGYLVHGAAELWARVQAQQERTDAAMAELSGLGASRRTCFQPLTGFRVKISENAISGFEAFDFYTRCIDSLLNELALLRSAPGDLELSRSFTAYVSLLHAMEQVGRLRAMVYMDILMSPDVMDYDFQHFVLATEVRYQNSLENFRRNAGQDALDVVDQGLAQTEIQDVFDLGKRIVEQVSSPASFPANLWFEKSTHAVELLKSAAQEMNRMLEVKTQAVIAEVTKNIVLLSIFCAAVLLLIVYLTWTTIRSILQRLGNLLFQIEQIRHTDDLSLRIPSEGKDELASIAGEFNKMMDSIERLMREQELQARQDPLTRIGNRLFFNEAMDRELILSQRYARSFSLILFDIDKFKHINDQYGHDQGDLVLQALAGLIGSTIRKADVFARWGGEEFVILTPETDLQTTVNLAEKLRSLIADHDFPGVGQVTVSFGVTTLVAEDNADTLLKRADQALLTAKNKGRNRVESSATDR